MSATSTIAVVVVTIATSATLGVAQHQGWGAFGEFEQSMSSGLEACEPPIRSVAWASGIGSQSIARTRALVSWAKKARRHGSTYISWHNARNRDISCETLAHNDAKCVIKGRPCKRQPEMKTNQLF